MPEVHILGQVVGASDFPHRRLLCRWRVVADTTHWDVVTGVIDGQTHVVDKDEDDFAVWAHPIDVHYSTASIEGWPQLSFEVWQQDEHGRNEISGYGSCRVPTAPGVHRLECVTWRPEGSFLERLKASMLGGHPQLKDPAVVTESFDRVELSTETRGSVHVELQLLVKGFGIKGVEFAGLDGAEGGGEGAS